MNANNLKLSSLPSSVASCAALTDRKLRVESTLLFQGEREVVIIHEEQEYRLRITRNGKLILTK
jgi:hemin uptake protein HemP